CEVLYNARDDPKMYQKDIDALTLHGETLIQSIKFKYLGVYFTCNGIDVETQVLQSITKAKTQANILSTIGSNGFGYSYETNVKIYKSMVRPLLEYCLCILPLTKKHMNKLKQAQNECLNKLMTVSRNTSYVAKQLILGVSTMRQRRDELQARWYLRVLNRKGGGDHLIKECLEHNTWYCRKKGKQRKLVPFYNTETNVLVQGYN